MYNGLAMRYYIKDDGETAEDARELPKAATGAWAGDCAGFAEEAAQYVFDNRDGWERSWPIIFTVIDDAGVELDFLVGMEAIPSFSATPVGDGNG
jgi:hypothetical protein